MEKEKRKVRKRRKHSALKRLTALLMVACLIVPILPKLDFETKAAQPDMYGFTNSIPKSFNSNDGKNPYGKGYKALNPISELFMYRTSGDGFDIKTYNDINTQKDGMEGSRANTLVNSSSKSDLHYADVVSFDPDGGGRNYMTAVVGMYYGSGDWKDDMVCMDIYNSRSAGRKNRIVVFSDNKHNYNAGWFDSFNQWEYRNYFNITSGDFDGDGNDEIAVYVPYREKPSVRIYDVNADGKATQKGADIPFRDFMQGDTDVNEVDILKTIESDDGTTKRAMIQCSLAAADLDRDGKDELVISGSWGDVNDDDTGKKIKDRSTAVAIYKYETDDPATEDVETDDPATEDVVEEEKNTLINSWRIKEETKNEKGEVVGGQRMRTAAVTTGDIDYDGFPEVVVAGYKNEFTAKHMDNYSKSYFVTTFKYDVNAGKFGRGSLQELGMTAFVKDGLYLDDAIQPQPAICCAAINGRNDKEALFLGGNYYFFNDQWEAADGEAGTHSIYKKKDNEIGVNLITNTWIDEAVAGNFDGNELGIEQVYSTSGYKKAATHFYFYAIQLDGKKVNTNSEGLKEPGDWYHSRWKYAIYHKHRDNNVCLSLAPTDCDNDSELIKYKSKSYQYTDTDILAVLEAAPYFEDLENEYDDTTGATTFGMTDGSGSSTTNTKEASVGAFATFHAQCKFATFTTEATYMHGWQWEYEKEQTVEYSIDFAGGYREHTVVLYRTPMVLYNYDVIYPNGKTGFMKVGIPENPVYSTMALDKFNEIAANDNNGAMRNKVIDETVISSIPGQPTTYHQSSANIPDFTGHKNFATSNSESTAINTQTITTGESSSSSQSYTNSFELSEVVEFGTDALGGGVGVIGGGGRGGGKTTMDYSSVTKSGEVPSQPKTDFPYSFDWKFGTWRAKLGKEEVPVLGYIINNVQAPPSQPKNIAINEATKNSITLAWEHGVVQPTQYILYQHFEDNISDDGYLKIAELDGTETSYTYEGLVPGKTYSFAMASVGINADTGEKVMSNKTEPVKGYTMKDGAAPVVQSISGDQKVCPGDTAVFSVNAFPSDSASSIGLNYNWQVKKPGENLWSRAEFISNSKLTLNEVTGEMNGNLYRCELVELSNGERNYCYTAPMKLTVGKAESVTSVTALAKDKNFGDADYNKQVVTTYEEEAPKVVEITIGDTMDQYTVYENLDESSKETVPYLYLSQTDDNFYILKNYNQNEATAEERIQLHNEDPYYSAEYEASKVVDVKIGDATDSYVIYKNADEASKTNIPYVYRSKTDKEFYVLTNYNQETAIAESRAKFDKDISVLSMELENREIRFDIPELELHGAPTYEAGGVIYDVYRAVKKVDDGTVTEQLEVYKNGDKYYTKATDGTMAEWTADSYTLEKSYREEPDVESIEEDETTVEYLKWYLSLEGKEIPIYGKESEPGYYVKASDGIKEILVSLTSRQTGVLKSDVIESEDGTSSVQYSVQPEKFALTETVTREEISYEFVAGEEVTLTTTVVSKHISNEMKSINGNIMYDIVNNQTGDRTTLSQDISGTGKGTAEQKWTPSDSGDYTIKVTYSGNDYLNMSYGTTSFYAGAGESRADYVLTTPDSVYYGETIELIPKKVAHKADNPDTPEIESDMLETTDLPEGTSVTYQVEYAKEGSVVTEEITKSYTPATPGVYRFASTIDGYTATKAVRVLKRPITITAPSKSKIPLDAGVEKVPSINEVSVSFTGDADKTAILESEAEKYPLKDMVYFEAAPTKDSGAGEHEVKLALQKTETGENTELVQEFLEKYEVTFEIGHYNIVDNGHIVNIEAGSNGSVKAFSGDDKREFISGSSLNHNEKLSLKAASNADYKVGKWTVKDADGTLMVENVDYTVTDKKYLSIDKVTKSLDIQVSFVPITHNVTYSAGENGSITAKYLINGEEGTSSMNSPEPVQAGKSVRLTAIPDEGYVVKQWLISKNGGTAQPKLNDDGTIFSGNTLDLNEVRETYVVKVEFDEIAYYDIATSVVCEDQGSAAGNSVEVLGLNAEGKAVKGSTITFKGKLTESSKVAEWRIYEEGKTEPKVIQADSDTYVLYNIRGNVKVEMSVAGSKKYLIHFKAVDEEGVEVPDALKAKSGAEDLVSDVAYTAYVPVEWYATLPDAYQITGWTLKTANDGETKIDEPNETLSIESLDCETTVTLHLMKRPSLTLTALDENGTIFCEELGDGSHVDKGRTEPVIVSLSPKYGYEVDAVTVTGADYEIVPSNTTTDVGLKLTKEGGFTDDMTVTVSYKELPTAINVSYDMHDIGDGVHGTVKAVADRMGNTEYERSAEEGTTGTLQEVYRDTIVTFTATPEEGYIVSKWYVNDKEVTNGITSGTSSNDTFALEIDENYTTDVKVTAQMGQSGNRIKYGPNVAGCGSVTAFNERTQENLVSGNSVAENTNVTFTATANPGYELTGWMADGRLVEGETDTIYVYRATGLTNVNILAVFEELRYGFSLEDTNGVITATAKVGEKDEPLKNGDKPRGNTAITVSATANPGWKFAGWNITGVELTEEEKQSNPLTFTTGRKDVSVKAVYEKENNCTVNYSVDTPEGGSLEASIGTEAFASGSKAAAEDKVVLKAIPNENYKVIKWMVDGVAINTNAPTYTLDVSKAEHTVSVSYGLVASKITFESNDKTMGTIEAKCANQNLQSGASVDVYSNVSFTAKPAAGYMVEGWYSDKEFTNRIEGTEAEQLSFGKTSVYGDYAVYVKFIRIPEYTVGIKVNGTGVGTVKAFVNGKEVSIADDKITAPRHSKITVQAAPYNKYNYLEKWNGAEAESLTYTIADLSKDETVTATFSPAELVDVRLNVQDGVAAKVSAGYDNNLKDIAAVGKAVQVINGQSVCFEVMVPEGKMIDKWVITYNDGTVKEGNAVGYKKTLNINNLAQGVTVDVILTDLVALNIPAEGEYDVDEDGVTDYILSNRQILPGEEMLTDDENKIRRNGNVQFTLTPAKDQRFTKIADLSSDATGNILTKKAGKGDSYLVVIENVLADVKMDVQTEYCYTITLPEVKNGSITVTDGKGKQIKSGDRVSKGTKLNLEAKAADHYLFAGWNGSGWKAAEAGKTAKATIENVSNNITIGGTFKWETRYYTVSYENTAGGKLVVTDAKGKAVSNGTKVEEGTVLNFKAEPDAHYAFLGFEGSVSGKDVNAQLKVEKDVKVKASFGWEDYYYTLSVKDDKHGTIKIKDAKGTTYKNGDKILENTVLTITAKPDKRYLLASWGMTTGRKKTVTLTMTADTMVSAVFVPEKDMKFTVAKGKYVITKTAVGRIGTVECVGTEKMAKKGKLTIPNTVKIQGITYKVTSIGKKAFYNCSKIKSVTIGKNVKVIKADAFRNCKNLKTVVIGDGVTIIKTLAFYNCKNLKTITVGKNVTTIEDHAFCKNRKLSKVVVKTTKLKKTPDHLFYQSGDITVYLPAKKYKAYKKRFCNKGEYGKVTFKKLK